MSKYKNIKSTCNKKSCMLVLPEPTTKVLAELTGVSESLVKKVRTGNRSDNSDKAKLVKFCHDLIIGGQEVLIQEVQRTVAIIKQTPSNI